MARAPDMPETMVISWNLTRKCHLQCDHCYIEAGREATRDGELGTEDALKVIDQLAQVNPQALLIFTGGEPLLRRDLRELATYATQKGFWVVVGTNFLPLDGRVAQELVDCGVKGFGLSLDSLDPEQHDAFRHAKGSFQNNIKSMQALKAMGIPFLVQTTVHQGNLNDIEDMVAFAHFHGAKVFNLYFLVPTGRGAYVSDLSPAQHDAVLHRVMGLRPQYAGKIHLNVKCAPHFQRMLYEENPQHENLRTYAGGGGCPAGTGYLGITPEGDVTPCPYLPVYGGNLMQTTFREIWESSEVFTKIRKRHHLSGTCGQCEFAGICSGCRARAWAEHGDVLAQDDLCTYTPGAHGGKYIPPEGLTYGASGAAGELAWEENALSLLANVPGFVRAMVKKKAEDTARERGLAMVCGDLMKELRGSAASRVMRMPFFKRPG